MNCLWKACTLNYPSHDPAQYVSLLLTFPASIIFFGRRLQPGSLDPSYLALVSYEPTVLSKLGIQVEIMANAIGPDDQNSSI